MVETSLFFNYMPFYRSYKLAKPGEMNSTWLANKLANGILFT